MRNGFKIADTDCHQNERPDLWVERIEAPFRDRAPAYESVDGRPVMFVEGERILSERRYRHQVAMPEYVAALMRGMDRTRRLREAQFAPEARLLDMDEQGVDVQILHPTLGSQLIGREFRDEELLAASCRAYNDWSRDYCAIAPDRLRWSAMLPFQAPALAIEEIRRASQAGCAGYYVRPNPIKGRNLSHPDYEPVWSEVERWGLPVCLHDSSSSHLPSYGSRMDTHTTNRIVFHPFEAMGAMLSLIWDGVLERHPRLTIVHVECDAGWLPYWLQRMEEHYEFAGNAEHPEMKMAPTKYFERQVFVAARGDERTLPSVVELVGDDNLTFNTDYPHPDGSYPFGFERFEELVIPDASKRKILWDNAARAFGL